MDRDLFDFLQFLSQKTAMSLKPRGDDVDSRKDFDRQIAMLIWLRDNGYVDCPDGRILSDRSSDGFKYLAAITNGLKYPGHKAVSYGTYEAYQEAEMKKSGTMSFTDQSITIHGSVNHSALALNSTNVSQTTKNADDIKGLIESITNALKNDKTLTEQKINDALMDLESLEKQLGKAEPHPAVLTGLLDNLVRIAPIAALVNKLWSQTGLPML